MLLSRLTFLSILLSLSFFLISNCVDEHYINVAEDNLTGSIFVESVPPGAKIFLMGTDTKKVTPDSIVNLESGTYDVGLSIEDYQDTNFTVQVFKSKITSKLVELKPIEFNGKIVVLSTPEGAEIFLNDEKTNKITPDSILNLKNGNYLISLKLKNYLDTTIQINLQKDERFLIDAKLTEKIPQGRIFIDSEPQNAQISLNGIQTGFYTPDTITNLRSGIYSISLTKEGFFDTTFTVILNEDEFNTKFISLREIPSYGNLFISSSPEGAKILLQGKNTEKNTPDTLKYLAAGPYLVTLTLIDFMDTSFIAYVEEGKTNNYQINMVENLPNLEVSISYTVSQNGQLIFTFIFNQDINLSYINIFLPGSINPLRFDFYNQQYSENYPIELAYPEKVNGIWNFEIYGSKVRGLKNNFEIIKELEVK